jgi:hypothetical protein
VLKTIIYTCIFGTICPEFINSTTRASSFSELLGKKTKLELGLGSGFMLLFVQILKMQDWHELFSLPHLRATFPMHEIKLVLPIVSDHIVKPRGELR